MNLKPARLLEQYLHLMQFDIHKAMMITKLSRLASDIKGCWLDIGAGDQPYIKYFANADKYLTTNTKRHYSDQDFRQLKNTTTYWIEDGKELPLPDHSLDGVACFQVLSVIDNPGAFFKEIERVLKPSGKLLITTDFLYPVWSREDRSRHTAFSLEEHTRNTGFCNISTESFGGFGSMMYALFMRYTRSFPGIWKGKSEWMKIICLIPYILILMLLPIISLAGMAIFLVEQNTTSATDFTFNILLKAEKESS